MRCPVVRLRMHYNDQEGRCDRVAAIRQFLPGFPWAFSLCRGSHKLGCGDTAEDGDQRDDHQASEPERLVLGHRECFHAGGNRTASVHPLLYAETMTIRASRRTVPLNTASNRSGFLPNDRIFTTLISRAARQSSPLVHASVLDFIQSFKSSPCWNDLGIRYTRDSFWSSLTARKEKEYQELRTYIEDLVMHNARTDQDLSVLFSDPHPFLSHPMIDTIIGLFNYSAMKRITGLFFSYWDFC